MSTEETSIRRRSGQGGQGAAKVIWVLLSIPIVYLVLRQSVAYLCERPLYPGDRIEKRTCRECGAKPVTQQFGAAVSCFACQGKGQLEVLVPGPERPTKVWGLVADWKAADSTLSYKCPKHIRVGLGESFLLTSEEHTIQGGLTGALVTFEGPTGTVSCKAGSSGRFNCNLSPGRHRVKVEAAGFRPIDTTIDIQPLRDPIWFERQRILRERSSDERRGLDGIALVLLLEKAGEGGGLLRTYLIPE